MINIKKIINSNDAVTGIVVAILLLGLFMTMLAFVQTVYVPQWMEQKEAEHMEQVSTQFNQLKYVVDTLIINEKQNLPISCPITLGSKEMPFLTSNRAYGDLIFNEDACVVTLINNENVELSYTLGSFEYKSDNSYFINQDYTFENGAMILSQETGDFISIAPSFTVVDSDHIVVNLIKFIGVHGKTSASGYGTYPVQTKLISTKPVNMQYPITLQIKTNHVEAWYNYLNELIDDLSKNYISPQISYTAEGDGVVLTLLTDTQVNYLTIEAYITEIEIQISPGWIN